MALQLLKRVATKALDKAGSAAYSAFNYLTKNAPEVLQPQRPQQSVLDRANQNSTRIRQQYIAPVAEPVANTLGRTLQKIPKVENKYDLPVTDIFSQAYNFASEIPRSMGRTLENQSTPQGRDVFNKGLEQYPTQLKNRDWMGILQNPATEDVLNATDLLPGGLIFGGVKAIGKKGVLNTGKQILEAQAAKNLAKQVNPNLIDDIATPITENFFRPKGSKNQVDFVAQADGTLKEVTEMGKKKTKEFFANMEVPTESLGNRGNLLPEGKVPLSLPRPESPATLGQIKKLAQQGDDFGGVTEFVAKDADEARQAVQAGLPADKIRVSAPQKAGKGFVVGEAGGVGRTVDEVVDDAVKRVADLTDFNPGNKVSRWIRKQFLDTPDNLKRTFGTMYDTHVAPIIKSHADRLAQGVDWKNSYYKKLQDLPVKAGSGDDKLIRTIGKKGGFEKVRALVGDERAKQIADTYTQMRGMYDEIIDTINTSRQNAGLPTIPKKDDFLSQIGSGKKSIFDLGIDKANYTTDEVSSAIFKKQGKDATTGAIESMRDYLEYAQRAGFSDLTGKDLANLRGILGKSESVPREVLEQLRRMEETILGTKEINPIQKGIENIAGTMRGAKVIGKLSTLISQGLSIPQAIVEAGPINFIKGQFSKEAVEAVTKSQFLKVANQSVPRSLRTGNAYTKALGLGGDALREGQNVASTTIWKGLYSRARQMGLKGADAIAWVDSELPKLVGDRRLGMGPEAYNTFVGKIFGAFTIEPTAAITQLVKRVGQKDVGKVVGTLFAWHVGNTLNEKYGTGYRPFTDPAQAVMDAYEFSTGSENKKQSDIKAITTLFAEGLQAAPIANNMFNTAYSVGETAGILPDSRDVMGNDQTWMNAGSLYNPLDGWDRNITGNKLIDAPANIASNFIPGVDSTLKGIQAGKTMNRGYAVTKDGSPMYGAPEGVVEKGRALAFGQSATQNARDWFDNDFAGWLTDTQKNVASLIPDKQTRVDFVKNAQSRQETLNKLQNTTSDGGSSPSLFGGEKTTTGSTASTAAGSLISKPTTQAQKDQNKLVVEEMLASGAPVSDGDISLVYFDGQTYDKSARKGQQTILEQMIKVADDEFLTPEQKTQIANAAKINPNDLQYYRTASLDEEEREASVLEYAASIQPENRDEFLQNLMLGRRAVGGKSLFSIGIFDRLYDEGLVSGDEKKLLNAVKYDPVFNKFYMDRDYKGSGGGGATKSQIKSQISKVNALYKDMLKPSSNSDNLNNSFTNAFSKSTQAPKLNLSTRRGQAPSSTGKWFQSY